MSTAIRQILVFFIVVLVVKCSQSYTLSYPEAGDIDGVYEPMDIYNPDAVNLPRYSSLEQRSERFAAPRGKRFQSGWPTAGYRFRAPRPGKRTYVLDSLPSDERSEETDNAFKRVVLRSGDSRLYRNNEDMGIMPESGTRPKEQAGFLRIGRGGPSKRQSFLRIGRGSPDDGDTEDESYIRMGRAMEADKRAQFLRIGRSSAPDQDNSGYIRMGRPMGGDLDSSFLRIGRGQPQLLQSGEQAPMMAARSSRPKRVKTPEPSFLRFGRSAPGFTLNADDLLFLLNHRQDLMRLLEHTNITDSVNGYFAFPRQGRAMSFYFPRMGRSGDDVTADNDCCQEGVRNVFAMEKGAFEICPRSKPCCSGFQEKSKLYSNVVLTECTRDTSLDKIRELMTEN